MSRISRLERGRVTADWTALYVKLFAQRCNVPNIFRIRAHRPETFSTRMAHFAAVFNTGKVPTRLKEVSFHRQHRAN